MRNIIYKYCHQTAAVYIIVLIKSKSHIDMWPILTDAIKMANLITLGCMHISEVLRLHFRHVLCKEKWNWKQADSSENVSIFLFIFVSLQRGVNLVILFQCYEINYLTVWVSYRWHWVYTIITFKGISTRYTICVTRFLGLFMNKNSTTDSCTRMSHSLSLYY